MPSYEEVMEAREAETAQKPAGPTPQQLAAFMRESQRGAAVLRELLDSPAWNVFRSVVGGALESVEAERAILRERLDVGEIVGDERVRADLRSQFLRGRIESLHFAMDLPKQLIGQHEKLDVNPAGNGHAVPADVTYTPFVGTLEPPPAAPKPRRKRKKH